MGAKEFVRGLANDVPEDGIDVNATLPSIARTSGTSVMPNGIIGTTGN
jgi:hypothetical protein